MHSPIPAPERPSGPASVRRPTSRNPVASPATTRHDRRSLGRARLRYGVPFWGRCQSPLTHTDRCPARSCAKRAVSNPARSCPPHVWRGSIVQAAAPAARRDEAESPLSSRPRRMLRYPDAGARNQRDGIGRRGSVGHSTASSMFLTSRPSSVSPVISSSRLKKRVSGSSWRARSCR